MLPEATEVYMLDNQSVMLSLKKLPIDKAITFCHMEQNLCMIQSTLSLKNDGLVYALILLTPTVFLVNLSPRARIQVYHFLQFHSSGNKALSQPTMQNIYPTGSWSRISLRSV